MKKYATFFIYFILLLVLCGCASSRFTETDHTEGQSITVADDTPMGEHMDTSVSTDTLHTTDAMITADAITATDAISTTDQLIITQDDLELVEPVLGIGYRFDSILKNYKERILFESNNCVAWKNSRGYMVACKTENGTGICALVQFSEDLELLEAKGIEPIDAVNTEEWVGKETEQFIEQYGPYHFNFSNSPYSFGIPSYISSTGNIYILHFHSGTYGPITSISSLCLKDLSFKYSSIYEVHIGDSLVSVREKVKDRLLDESFNFLLWSDSSGYCICLAPDDCETICSIVRFSEELELLEATGIVPIPAIDLKDQEKWVGKTEAEFIEQYGYCHFDFGSGIYMPNYIAETGEIYWFTVENGVIVRFRSYFVNQ